MLLTAREQGARYFVIFEFVEIGYVKEDDKDELDGDALLESLREGTEAGNEFRREHGWGEIEVVGWERAPFYDQRTNNLTWATKVRGKGADGGESINWSTRLLGRRGVMNVDLVLAPEDLTVALGEFETSLGGFEFSPGHRYREWATGDKVAAVGLGALVLGGAGAIAAKTGLLAKFWTLILAAGKWIVIGLGAIGAGLRKLFSGKRGESETGPPPSPPPPPPIPTT